MERLGLILLGPPGAGKGTQAKKLELEFGYKQISTGDLLRKAVQDGTQIGRVAEGYMKKGALVPDDIIIKLVKGAILQHERFILDGFPRNISQANMLEDLLSEIHARLQYVILLSVSDDEIVHRLLARRVCPVCGRVYNLLTSPPKNDNLCDDCGVPLVKREDDNEETIRNRLKVYREETAPLIDYYRKKKILKEVSASSSVDRVFAKIAEILGGNFQ